MSFPRLTSLYAGINIERNPKLLVIDGFPVLDTVGYLGVKGAFTNVSLPSLNYIEGDVSIESIAKKFQRPIPQFAGNVTAEGHKFDCAGSCPYSQKALIL